MNDDEANARTYFGTGQTPKEERVSEVEAMARRLYTNEPPKPQQPWETLSEETREHYLKYARNLAGDLR